MHEKRFEILFIGIVIMGRCIPCEEAEARNAKVQAADRAARAWLRSHPETDRVLLVEVLRDGDGFTAGDYTFCLPGDVRLQTIFYEVNVIL